MLIQSPLVAPACCCINSPRPLVAPPSCPLVALAGCCVASRYAALFLSGRPRRAALSLSCRLVVPPSRCLVTPAGCRIISHRPLVMPPYHFLIVLLAPPSRPLVVPAIVASPSPCCSPLPTPSNTIECCLRHRTPPPRHRHH